MKRLNFIPFLLIISFGYHSGCAPVKQQSPATEKKLPGTVSMNPSSFRCEGVVIESNSKSINFVISKILQQGSSLFYPVSAGDTLVATFQSPGKNIYAPQKHVELMIEERVMLNSDKPEFIVRQIKIM